MAEGFGRWESDPLFPAAECVQDSADRMETVFRLLLHERKLVPGDTSDMKFFVPIQYERDVVTALGTTKWQLEQFEREVNAAACSDKLNLRENAISKFRQFIRAIRGQIAQAEESIENFKADSSGNSQYLHSSEHDSDGLASFLSGGAKDPQLYDSTNTDEIVELKAEGIPSVNGYGSSKEHATRELRYSGEDMEEQCVFQYSCGENECQGDHDSRRRYDSEAGDSTGNCYPYNSRLSRQYWSFLGNLWFINRGRESFTKRRKDGEVQDDLINGPDRNLLPSFNVPSTERGTYFWKGWIPSSRASQGSNIAENISFFQFHNRPQIRSATAILIALAVLGLLAFHVA